MSETFAGPFITKAWISCPPSPENFPLRTEAIGSKKKAAKGGKSKKAAVQEEEEVEEEVAAASA